MATAYKVIGQSYPTLATNTDIYTVPSATEVVISSVVAANQGTIADYVNVAVRPDGESIASKHYVCKGMSVPPNGTLILTVGITANASDVITVYSSNGSTSFNIFGSEIS